MSSILTLARMSVAVAAAATLPIAGAYRGDTALLRPTSTQIRMQHHPFVDRNARLANAAFDPYPFYEPDVEFVGSMKPGTRPENAPYEAVMGRAHLVDNTNVVEWSLDDRAPIIRDPDDKFLDWIRDNGLLYDEMGGEDAFVPAVEAAVVLEDEFEFEDGLGGSLGFEDGESLL
mmetsp:Transcript_11129/g.28962  ORF Transcript_11129/g.28962 Transcript_11129/m.28962 type:complete len:174 (-) Transcript_11129:29-550(-)